MGETKTEAVTYGTRIGSEPEKLDRMYAHTGKCNHCEGPVKMHRDMRTGRLLPNVCNCFLCGQRYYMEIPDIHAWEIEQWQQKV